jgi:proliferating cell nuclear antigen
MDSSHVSLVSLLLSGDGLENYRCDNNMSLGINIASMTKILKTADNSDVASMEAEQSDDVVLFKFENTSKLL